MVEYVPAPHPPEQAHGIRGPRNDSLWIVMVPKACDIMYHARWHTAHALCMANSHQPKHSNFPPAGCGRHHQPTVFIWSLTSDIQNVQHLDFVCTTLRLSLYNLLRPYSRSRTTLPVSTPAPTLAPIITTTTTYQQLGVLHPKARTRHIIPTSTTHWLLFVIFSFSKFASWNLAYTCCLLDWSLVSVLLVPPGASKSFLIPPWVKRCCLV